MTMHPLCFLWGKWQRRHFSLPFYSIHYASTGYCLNVFLLLRGIEIVLLYTSLSTEKNLLNENQHKNVLNK